MSDVVIRAEHVGKRYHIGATDQVMRQYRTLNHAVAWRTRYLRQRVINAIRGQAPPTLPPSPHEFWALNDVSFEIKQGEVVGIIGRNGSGKSTLLKILARITEPTRGHIDITGRVGSLLEVGTGFHPELTGRENIFLNGAILGMKKAEIAKKFDEIVAFSEIEQFLETPVKRYSSGMYVRLAFAVAAHLEPEILLVDEVLAVGDTAFQKKCLGKMGEVAGEGRTVFFVSHNSAAIEQLCTECLWLDTGRFMQIGATRDVVSAYCRHGDVIVRDGVIPENMHVHQPLELVFTSISLNKHLDNSEQIVFCGEPIELDISFIVREPMTTPRIGIMISRTDGMVISVIHHTDNPDNVIREFSQGLSTLHVTLDLPLMPGEYNIDLFAKPLPGYWGSKERSMDWVQRVLVFRVKQPINDQFQPQWHTGGLMMPSSNWSLSPSNDSGMTNVNV